MNAEPGGSEVVEERGQVSRYCPINGTQSQLPHSLLHLLLHGLVCAHDRLLVDHNLGCIWSWSAYARRDSSWVGVDDNSASYDIVISSNFITFHGQDLYNGHKQMRKSTRTHHQ
jgi:hypothetical protein